MTTQTAPLCVTTLNEIDDVQIGDTVYLPMVRGGLHSVEGQSISYKPYKVARYYKRGYEDRLMATSESGECRIRYNYNKGYWVSDCHRPISSTPVGTTNTSLFDSGII